MFSFQLEGFPFFFPQHTTLGLPFLIGSWNPRSDREKRKKNPATTLRFPLLPRGKEFFNVSFFPRGKTKWVVVRLTAQNCSSQRRVANSEVWYIQRHFLPKCNRAVLAPPFSSPPFIYFFVFFYLDPGNGNWWRGPSFLSFLFFLHIALATTGWTTLIRTPPVFPLFFSLSASSPSP